MHVFHLRQSSVSVRVGMNVPLLCMISMKNMGDKCSGIQHLSVLIPCQSIVILYISVCVDRMIELLLIGTAISCLYVIFALVILLNVFPCHLSSYVCNASLRGCS